MTAGRGAARADATAVVAVTTGIVVVTAMIVDTILAVTTPVDMTDVVATSRPGTVAPATTPGDPTPGESRRNHLAGNGWFGHVDSARTIALRSAEVTQRWYFFFTAI